MDLFCPGNTDNFNCMWSSQRYLLSFLFHKRFFLSEKIEDFGSFVTSVDISFAINHYGYSVNAYVRIDKSYVCGQINCCCQIMSQTL